MSSLQPQDPEGTTQSGSSEISEPTNPLPFWSFLALLIVVQLLDILISKRVSLGPAAQEQVQIDIIATGEKIADAALFVALGIALIAKAVRARPKIVIASLVLFLSVATLNLLANVIALVATAELQQVERLSLLWDVGLVYLATVLVFGAWYRVLDAELPGGAFEFPVDPERPQRSPGWVDYIFISFNANATFGPTSEVVHSRTAKVLMMIQTLMSLLVLVVLLARISGLT
ncbi:MAG: hypothetical protein WD029_01000 [Microthrixaceae bacterium]